MTYHNEIIKTCKKYTIKAKEEMWIDNNSFTTFHPRFIQVNSSIPSNLCSKAECVDVDIFGSITPELPVVFLTNIKQQGQERICGIEVQQKMMIRNNKNEDVLVSFS